MRVKLTPIQLSVVVVMLLLLVACTNNEQEGADEDVDAANQQEPDEDVDDGPECETWDDEPVGLFLTWQQDPTSTMTIDWHTVDEEDDEPRESLCFRGADTDEWTGEAKANAYEVPYLDRTLWRVELTDLEAGSEYVFQVGHFEREFRFRTMPGDIDDESVTFAAGGDTMHLPGLFEPTNRAVMEYDPDFIVFGGDLAYADAGTDPFHEDRWGWWFETILETLVDDDGRVIPIIAGIGNHEVVDGYYYEHDDYEQTDAWRRENAPYYYTFFAFPGQPGYGVLDFGDYMSLVVLDSDHSNPVEGEQTEWLESVLSERHSRGVSHVFPVYHVAAFPSHREWDDPIPGRIREHWVPPFEEYGVEVVFEKHDHTYKRTHPIRGGQVDEDEGIVYIGDGAWGVQTRSGDSKDEWYIDQFASERHAIIFTIDGDDHYALVVSEDKVVIDEYGEVP